MSTYYDYFLEKKTDDGWHKVINIFDEESQKEPFSIYWHSRSFGSESAEYYSREYLSYEEWNLEDQIEFKDKYEKIQKDQKNYDWLPEYRVLDLNQMIKDFNEEIHEYSGIMSKNEVLKLQRDCDYYPDIIKPKDFNKLPKNIQDNYQYYAWDTWWSDYKNAYNLVPLIYKLLDYYNLKLEDVRLTYYWS